MLQRCTREDPIGGESDISSSLKVEVFIPIFAASHFLLYTFQCLGSIPLHLHSPISSWTNKTIPNPGFPNFSVLNRRQHRHLRPLLPRQTSELPSSTNQQILMSIPHLHPNLQKARLTRSTKTNQRSNNGSPNSFSYCAHPCRLS